MAFHNIEIRNKKRYKNPLDNSQNFIYKERGLKNDYDSYLLQSLSWIY